VGNPSLTFLFSGTHWLLWQLIIFLLMEDSFPQLLGAHIQLWKWFPLNFKLSKLRCKITSC
jgi:hypothetical protein